MRWPWVRTRKVRDAARTIDIIADDTSGDRPPDTDDPTKLAYAMGEQQGFRQGMQYAALIVRRIALDEEQGDRSQP